MSSNTRYNKRYWLLNRARLLREKRERYRRDPFYRDKALRRSRGQVALKRIQRKFSPSVVIHAGKKERRMTCQAMADACKRSVDLIFLWRKKGIIPPATHGLEDRYVSYSESQVRFVQEVCQRLDAGESFPREAIRAMLDPVWQQSYAPGKMGNNKGGESWRGRKQSKAVSPR